MTMRIVAKRTLREFWRVHADAEQPLRTWYVHTKAAKWQGPADIRSMFRTADFVAGNRVIFDIGGNKYRLIGKVNYRRRVVFIRFVGTHKDYSRIDPETV
jgi:mRNA interferase HigB